MPKFLSRRGALPFFFAAAGAPLATVVTSTKGRSSTLAAEGVQPGVPQGYGQCSQCRCPGYQGNQQVCGNCGHNYGAHW